MEKTLIIGLLELEFDDNGCISISKDYGHYSDMIADLSKDDVIRLIKFLKDNIYPENAELKARQLEQNEILRKSAKQYVSYIIGRCKKP